MKKAQPKISATKEKELLNHVHNGSANNYRFVVEGTNVKVYSNYSSKEKPLYEGLEATFLKKAYDNRQKNLNSEINEKALKHLFQSYPMDSWIMTESGKSTSYYNRHNHNKIVKNLETGDTFYDKEASYLLTLMKLEESSRNKVKMSSKEILFNILTKDKTFSSIRALLSRAGKSIEDFANNYKGKTTSVDKLFNEVLKEVFPYKIPSHFVKEMFNQASPKLLVNASNDWRTKKTFQEVESSATNEWEKFIVKDNDKQESIDLQPGMDFKTLSIKKNDVWVWSSIIGNGYSFYKTIGKHFLTKSECHYFVNPPVNLKIDEAFIFAIAFSFSKDYSHSMKIAKIGNLHTPLMQALTASGNKNNFLGFDMRKVKFFINIIRFMASDKDFKDTKKIEEIADFFILGYYPRVNAKFIMDGTPEREIEIFGRKLTMARVYVETIAWHYELNRKKLMGNSSWAGLPLSNYEVVRMENGKEVKFVFSQILTASALQSEGRQMRHCVSSYVSSCVAGNKGIFSLVKISEFGREKKLLTIEVLNSGRIVQVKGLANREPKSFESELVRMFAKHNYLTW